MAVFRPRTRLVNFRLSETEYQQLKDSCARSGARSVSDYARAAVLTGSGLVSLDRYPPLGVGNAVSPIASCASGPLANSTGEHPQPPSPSLSAQPAPACGERWEKLEESVVEIQQRVQLLAEKLLHQLPPALHRSPLAGEITSNSQSVSPLQENRVEESAASHG